MAEAPASVGPEVHLSGYVTDHLGLWVNAGAQIGGGGDLEAFTWIGAEVASDVPFVALEVDLGLDAGGPWATLVPSVGVWLGAEGNTEVSVAWLALPSTARDRGWGSALYRPVALSKRARTRAGEDPTASLEGR